MFWNLEKPAGTTNSLCLTRSLAPWVMHLQWSIYMSHAFECIWDAASCLQKMRVHVCVPVTFCKNYKVTMKKRFWACDTIPSPATSSNTSASVVTHDAFLQGIRTPGTQPRLWLMMFFCQGWGFHHTSTEHLKKIISISSDVWWHLSYLPPSTTNFHHHPQPFGQGFGIKRQHTTLLTSFTRGHRLRSTMEHYGALFKPQGFMDTQWARAIHCAQPSPLPLLDRLFRLHVVIGKLFPYLLPQNGS